jgi:RND superfamily putative drug exporter
VIATVLASYVFALGVSALIFPESDPALPLFTFLFLVALGVDYNVFLLTRIRELRRDQDHENAVLNGLVRTGGVITSAGLILAGTFCTLLATELESLFQVGFTVALGLLVDTFLIRIFLVPSIALLLGSRAL